MSTRTNLLAVSLLIAVVWMLVSDEVYHQPTLHPAEFVGAAILLFAITGWRRRKPEAPAAARARPEILAPNGRA